MPFPAEYRTRLTAYVARGLHPFRARRLARAEFRAARWRRLAAQIRPTLYGDVRPVPTMTVER